jgi:HAMP domain-containing protein
LHSLATLRESIESMNLQCAQAAKELIQSRRRLSAEISAASSSRENVARHSADAGTSPQRLPVPVPSIPVAVTTSALTAPDAKTTDVAAPATAAGEVAGERIEKGAPRVMAIVTAIVMFIICLISVFTVRSIVLPVRRLVKAAGQLAKGESNVAVSRGGIRELDQLTGAFNEMASQLQTYHMERAYKLQRLSQEDPLLQAAAVVAGRPPDLLAEPPAIECIAERRARACRPPKSLRGCVLPRHRQLQEHQ